MVFYFHFLLAESVLCQQCVTLIQLSEWLLLLGTDFGRILQYFLAWIVFTVQSSSRQLADVQLSQMEVFQTFLSYHISIFMTELYAIFRQKHFMHHSCLCPLTDYALHCIEAFLRLYCCITIKLQCLADIVCVTLYNCTYPVVHFYYKVFSFIQFIQFYDFHQLAGNLRLKAKMHIYDREVWYCFEHVQFLLTVYLLKPTV